MIDMGERISETNENVDHLTENANKMEKNGLVAKETLKELESINAEVQSAIDVIYEQTNTTNDSANRISEAILLSGANMVGITAGASTPAWIIKEVHNKMSEEILEMHFLLYD